MNDAMSATHFRRGLLFTSSGSFVNLVLPALETIVVARLLPATLVGARTAPIRLLEETRG